MRSLFWLIEPLGVNTRGVLATSVFRCLMGSHDPKYAENAAFSGVSTEHKKQPPTVFLKNDVEGCKVDFVM
jgi:hypothetical protein